MELFKNYIEIIKWNGKMAKMLRNEWAPRILVQQCIIDINKDGTSCSAP